MIGRFCYWESPALERNYLPSRFIAPAHAAKGHLFRSIARVLVMNSSVWSCSDMMKVPLPGRRRVASPANFSWPTRGRFFLDDVDNLPVKVQIGLLRVLESSQIVPLGGSRPRAVNIRVIAASNRDLEQLVREGRFRADLYHRLRVVAIQLPPLRERSEDIPLLARQVLAQQSPAVSIMDEAVEALRQYSWPGNVRELKNVLTEAAAYVTSQCITISDLPTAAVSMVTPPLKSRQQVLDNTEAELIAQAVQQTGSVIQAARRLGLHHATLYRRMKKYNIPLPTERRPGS